MATKKKTSAAADKKKTTTTSEATTLDRAQTSVLEEAAARSLFDRYKEAIDSAEDNEDIDGVIDLTSLCSGSMAFYEGNLTVDELHLASGEPSLFIKGNVTVNGIIQQDFGAGFLVVFGDVEVNDLVCGAQIFISGSLTVKGTIFGNCTNYPTLVLGHTKAKTLVSAKEHYFCFYGGHTIKKMLDAQGDTPNLEDAEYGVDNLVNGIDGGHDTEAVVKLLRRGKPIVK